MNYFRYLLLGILIVILVSQGVIGSFAFSVLDVNRDTTISVTDENNGIVEIESNDEIDVGTNEELVSLTNQLNEESVNSINLDNSGWSFTNSDLTDSTSRSVDLEPEESSQFNVDTTNINADSAEYEIVTISGSFVFSQNRDVDIKSQLEFTIDGESSDVVISEERDFAEMRVDGLNVIAGDDRIDITSSNDDVATVEPDPAGSGPSDTRELVLTINDVGTTEVTAISEDGTSNTITVTVTGDAYYTVNIIDVNSATVGNDVVIDYEVENIGSISGNQDIVLESTEFDYEDVNSELSLESSDSTTDSFSIPTENAEPGVYEFVIKSEDEQDTDEFSVINLGKFNVNNVVIDDVIEGDDITVQYEITNTGDSERTEMINLEITPELPESSISSTSETVTLEGNENEVRELSISSSEGDNGVYNGIIKTDEDSQSSDFEIIQPLQISEFESNRAGNSPNIDISFTVNSLDSDISSIEVTAKDRDGLIQDSISYDNINQQEFSTEDRLNSRASPTIIEITIEDVDGRTITEELSQS